MGYWMWHTSELARWWYVLQLVIGALLIARFGARPLVILVVIGIIANCVHLYRCTSHAELDDVHPLMKCDKLDHFLDHPRLTKLWVVPMYNNVPITADPVWCAKIKHWADSKPGRVLGLHGYAHTDHECARIELSDAHLEHANQLFFEAFGRLPDEFKAPNYALTTKNRDFIESRGLRIATKGDSMFHQIFHCDTSYCLFGCKDIVQAHT